MNLISGKSREVLCCANAATVAAISAAALLAVYPANLSGQPIFYVANQDNLDKHELFVWDGKAPTGSKLSASLIEGGDVESVTTDKNGNVALYLADAEVDEQRELYAVEVKSGNVKRVSAPLTPGISVGRYEISRKGSDALYLAWGPESSPKLFHTNLKSDTVTSITADAAADGSVLDFAISPKGNSVAFIEGHQGLPYELYLADLNSGSVKQISTPRQDDTDVIEVRFDEIGNNVFYTTRRIDEIHIRIIPVGALFHHNIKSGETTQLPDTTEHCYITRFSIDAKGKTVAYVTQDEWEEEAVLHYVELKTGFHRILAATHTPWGVEGHRIFGIHECEVDPKGKQAAFTLGDAGHIGYLNISVADTKTGSIREVTNYVKVAERVWDLVGDKKWRSLFYIAYDSEQLQELFRVDMKTGEQVRLSLPQESNTDVYEALIDPKSRYAVYDWGENYWSRKLMFVDLKSSTTNELNPNASPGIGVMDYHVPGWKRLTGD